ncbi:carbohydrate ABC transporter permease [Breznakiella homolactica]|uniref:Sugar ABC transporter permease n=1 Tax=Breznakiella homolactica TaxID=2798577 RepID=A0A7T7XKA4_9SPIR|nr:sugar ABC transporter permease [Breznakiella homolactica]QQO07931.1 sugar ABC transporter permease [Breznakiella homolactica]
MQKNKTQSLWILFFVFPGLLIVSVVIIYPLFASLLNSFFSWQGFERQDFVGFKNFKAIFTQFPHNVRFFNAIKNNGKWFLGSMLIQNTIGLLFGYLLSRNIRGHGVYKRLFFMPVLLPIIAVGFLWKLYYNPQFGLFLKLFTALGIEHLFQPWLGNPSTATYAIIVMNIWRWIGFPTLVFLAAIDNVPGECLESAHLDGASEWRTFWRITFPLIIPSVMVITVLTLIGSVNVFEQVYSMAGLDGSPNYATDTLGTLFYRTAFGSQASTVPEVSIGSALSVIIYLLCLILSVLNILFFQKKEVEL